MPVLTAIAEAPKVPDTGFHVDVGLLAKQKGWQVLRYACM